MAPSSFRTAGWDPVLIIAQIVSLQTVFYITISLLLLIALALTGAELSLDFILDDAEIRIDTVFGWTLAIVWLVNAVLSIPLLVFIVQRAKLVLDFVLTLHFFHILGVWIHTQRFPTRGAWWFLQIMDAIIMTLGGEWACMRREMEPIMVSQKKTTTTTTTVEEDNPSDESDWVQVGTSSCSNNSNKMKRKVSDPSGEPFLAASGDNNNERVGDLSQDHAPFTRAVGKAKKVLLQSAQRAAARTNSKGKRYETIPLEDVNQSPDV